MKKRIKSSMKKHGFMKTIWQGLCFAISFLFGGRGYVKYYLIYPIKSFFRGLLAIIFPSYLGNIKGIKNKYSGESCVIVANGPSMQLEDLEMIKQSGMFSFGMNTVYRIYDKTKWRPNFYCCIDLEAFDMIIKEVGMKAFLEFATDNVFVDCEVKGIENSKKIIRILYNRLVHGWKVLDDDFRYSDDLVKGIYDTYSSASTAILLAKYMGFSNVYLIGCDCNRLSNKKHASGMESDLDECLTDDYASYFDRKQEKGNVYLAEKIKTISEFNVYNATRGGCLEAFPRVNFDDVIKKGIEG